MDGFHGNPAWPGARNELQGKMRGKFSTVGPPPRESEKEYINLIKLRLYFMLTSTEHCHKDITSWRISFFTNNGK